jgi:predicted ATPase
MNITALEIENFKGFSDRVRIDFKPITLLVGANSAGKSSIVQALMYLRDIVVDGDLFARNLTLSPEHDLGGLKNVLHQHDLGKSISMRLEMDFSRATDKSTQRREDYVPGYADLDPERFQDPESLRESSRHFRLRHNVAREIKSAWVELSIAWDGTLANSRPRVTKYSVGINGEWAGAIDSPTGSAGSYISGLNFEHPIFKPRDHEVWWNDVGHAYPPEDGNPRNEFEQELREMVPGNERWAGTDQVNIPVTSTSRNIGAMPSRAALRPRFKGTFTENFYNMMVGMLSEALVGPLDMAYGQLEKLKYLGPLRAIPPRDFGSEVFEKNSDWANGLAAWSQIIKNYEGGSLEHEAIGEWLGQYDVRVSRIRELDRDRVEHILDSKDPISNAHFQELKRAIDVESPFRWKIELVDKRSGTAVEPRDVGVGISQILPVIVAAETIGLTCIEQPELHLHPKMQVQLGDIFLKGWWGNEGLTQFLIETHSEHLILRLLRRVRERHVNPKDISILFVGSNDAMRTVITPLPVSEDGDFIEQWPGGFFDERAEELF